MGNMVTILGTRGSIPVSGVEYQIFGGSTTCVLVELDDTYIILDAGTGILNIPDAVLKKSRLPLILTHAHLDHLLGLPFFPYLFREEAHLTIYSVTRNGMNTQEQVDHLFSPPLWPIRMQEMPAPITFRELTQDMWIGNIRISSMQGVHPGGCSILRLTGRQHSIVFATDCTLTDRNRTSLLSFSEGCDLLLIDGQYSDEEWAARRTYGHNCWTEAARFGREAGARQIRIIHHDPAHTDIVLSAAEESIHAVYQNCLFAKEGETILL